MKYLKRLGIALLLVVALVIGGAFLLPGTTVVERSTVIQAPSCNVYVLLDGYGWWNDFSPWAGIDPETVYSYEGPTTGVGSKMIWQSEHPNVGSGSMELTTAEPCASIAHDLDFGAQGTPTATWTLEPVDGGTKATWNLVSTHGMNPMARYIGLMLDGWVGGDYERGLASLKTLAEGLPTADIGALELEETRIESQPMVAMDSRSAATAEAKAQALAAAYTRIDAFIQGAELQASGAPVAATLSSDADTWMFRAGIPVTGPLPKADAEGPVSLSATPAGEVLKVTHTGPYASLGDTYAAIDAWSTLHKRELGEGSWEVYVSDPTTTPEADLVTKIYLPLPSAG